jgi:hypothetical protein
MGSARSAFAALGISAALAAGGLGAHRAARPVEPIGTPPLRGVRLPCAWILVRTGCSHCAAHLDALGRAAAAFGGVASESLLARVHVVGWTARAPRGTIGEPDSLRHTLAARVAPTTWFVDSCGRIDQVWSGARGEHAWSRALHRLLLGGAPCAAGP